MTAIEAFVNVLAVPVAFKSTDSPFNIPKATPGISVGATLAEVEAIFGSPISDFVMDYRAYPTFGYLGGTYQDSRIYAVDGSCTVNAIFCPQNGDLTKLRTWRINVFNPNIPGTVAVALVPGTPLLIETSKWWGGLGAVLYLRTVKYAHAELAMIGPTDQGPFVCQNAWPLA